MAVEIPVYVDIASGFKYAASQIPKEMPKLESAVKRNVLNVPIDVSGFGTVRDVLTSTTISAKDLKRVLEEIEVEFNLAASAAASKKNTPAAVNNLAKAYGFVEQRITGVYNKYKVAQLQITATTKKVMYQIEQLRNQLATTAKGSDAFNKINYQIRIQEDRLRRLNLQFDQYGILAMQASNRVSSSMAQASAATNRAGDSMSRQTRLLQQVSSLAASYLSIWQVGRFVHNIRETTAEFEMQRVALAGIIQDTERANSLFRQIKAEALQSPFEIKDLVSYTKQLSAYRIETDKLFDVTKRLADVSAGLGVDMGRIILAYGQVRAASVLRGQELRQFTEAGIPLVEELAKKFTQLNGRMTSTAEVFELISKRAVPFSMIEEIFEDMTEAGGVFYKMQEKQAETLAGQWANLKDALSIMYDEIGNTPEVHRAMEDLIGSARTLMNNWRQIATILGVVSQGYVVLKVASLFMPRLAYNTEMAEKATLALARASALEARQMQQSNIIRGIAINNLKAYATQMGKAAAAQTVFGRGLHKVLAGLAGGGWIGVATTLITVLVGWISSAVKESQRLEKELTKIGSEGALSLNRSVSNFNRLADAAVNAADGSDEQNKAIAELQRTYGDIIPVEELQVKKLRELEGSYQSLTKAIEEKVNMQIREQKISAIEDAYSSKITKANKKAQRFLLQYGLDKDQIRAVLREVQDAVDSGLIGINDSFGEQAVFFEDTIKRLTGLAVDLGNGFRDYNGQWIRVNDSQENARNSLLKIVSIYSDLHSQTAEVENDMDSLIGSMGRYAKSWKDLESSLKSASVSEEVFGKKGTFTYKEALLKERVRRMVESIEEEFKDTGIDISAAFKTPDRIDFKFLAEAAKQAAVSGNWGIDSFVNKIQKKYQELVPSDEFTNVLKVKFAEIAESVGVSMDDIQGYLKKSDEDIRKYTKGIKEELQGAKDKLNEMYQQNEMSKQHPVILPVPEKDLKDQENLVKFFEALLKFLEQYQKQSKGPRDTRLSQLKSEISELTNAYKKFEELRKYKGKDEALIDIGKLFPQLKGWEPTLDNVIDKLQGKLKEVREKLAKAPKDKTLLDMQRALETEISNLKFDDLKNGIEEQLKRLSDEIKRSEAARNFYKDIFDLTGDETLSTSLAVEVYGGVGAEFRDRLQQQLNAVLSNISADADLSRAFQTQDFGYILDHLAQIPEKWHKEIKDLADAQQKFSADQIKTWLNELKKERDFSEQRVALARQTAERIAEIKATENLSDDEQRAFIEQYRKRERDQAAKLRYEAFKDNPLYIQMFGNLESASEEMLRAMKKNIKDMMSEWKNLDPTQLKEMQSRLQELDSQLARKNPFKVLGESVRKYNELVKAGRSKQSDTQKMVDDAKNLSDAENKLAKLITDLAAAEDAYKAAVDEFDEDSIQASAALEQKEALEQLVAQLTELIKKLRQSANASANAAGEWTDLGNNAKDAADEIEQWGQSLLSAVGAAEQFVGVFSDKGADVVKRISDITDSAVKLGAAIVKVATSEGADLQAWAQAAANIITMTAQIVDWIAAANLEKWNDQIAEQDKLVRRLERSYSKLERAMEKSFGSDYVYNYNEAMKELEAMQEAYAKEIEIQNKIAREASKQEDRDAASERASELEDEVDKVEQRLSELRTGLAEFFTGTSLTSAAEEFATAWLDAYRSFGNTTDAIKQKMEDMINNLIVKSSLAKAAEVVLKPFFDELAAAAETNTLTEQIPALISLLNQKTGDLNDALNALAQVWQANGISLRGTVGNLSGISRDIASASEESILALTAGINTQNFYMSYMPTISADVRQIVEIMSGSTGQAVTQTAPPEGAVMPSIQEMLYRDMPVIKSHLSNIESLLSKVITTGTNTGWYVATKM